jgi:hypothetical protein
MVQLDELAPEPAPAAPAVSNESPYGRLEKLSTEELRAEVARLAALRAAVEACERRGPLSDVDEEQVLTEERENEEGNAWCAAVGPSRHVVPGSRARRARRPWPADRMPPPGLEEVMQETLKFSNGDVYKVRRVAPRSVTRPLRPPVPAR